MSDIDISHRLGKFKAGYNRPIIVKFVTRQKRYYVMYNRKVFKGSNIHINEDLTNINQKVLMTIKKALSENEAVWSWYGKLYHKTTKGEIRPIDFEDYKQWMGKEWPKLINRFFDVK
ncbi:hypothetical protein DPMN_020271 [Dreissena polymorpha]|uniref:Uncharacterized protein n=1 Tax=Dreissena polymorpha TaxID=45954 RepID=A0A9D4SA22_DREPO|nr:hypothetical protein DPMN_020271 [Dreissena polymorpha]